MSALPKLASVKIDKERLRHEAWRVDQVFWRPNRNEPLREVDEIGEATPRSAPRLTFASG
jgi:fatty-acyl-CoA synthase